MKKLFSVFMAALLLLVSTSVSAKVKVHTIGDSTMADYDENTTDKRGWCTYLGNFFDAQYEVNNRGKSGSDTRGFYTNAGLWASVKSQMQAGDYLLIQFAHNDEGTVTNGMDIEDYKAYCAANGLAAPTDARGTNPQTTYRDYLRLFIDEARALGVNPVLVGPICRKYFSGNDIRRNGRHDLGDKFSKIENGVLYENQSVPASDHSMDYVEAMRIVAQEKNVPFVDMTEATRQLYLQYGEAQCTSLLFCQGDNTHTATLGANLIARLGAQLLKDNVPALSSHIDIPTDITAMPGSLDMGETYSGVQIAKEVLLTGFGLEPASGTVSLSATGDLLISTDNVTFAQTATATYSGSTLFQRVYVHASYTGAGAKADEIVVTSGSRSFSVPVTASVISLEGGTSVSAYWDVKTKPAAAAQVVGPVSAEMTLSHLVLWNVQAIGDSTMARFHNADDSGAKVNWPTEEIDENADRYVDFAITAPATMDIRVSGISMTLAANSTSAMCCHINYGFGDGFTGVTTLDEKLNITNGVPQPLSYTPTLTIPAGETLHVRVLPWHQHTSGSGKYICLSNVKIEGMAFEPEQTAIENLQSDNAARKMIIDGQLVIRRDGCLYTAQGQLLK